MSDSGIHTFEVAYTDGTKHTGAKPICLLCVEFGDGHRIEIDATGDHALLRLIGRHAAVMLDSAQTPSAFDRAINILRLRMPMRS